MAAMTDTSPRDGARDAMAAALSTERIDGDENAWTRRLVLFLRIMAVLSIVKGLYHWAQVTGFVGGEEEAFENQPMAWQAATVYFAVIELVAAVGLWLFAPVGGEKGAFENQPMAWQAATVYFAVIELVAAVGLWLATPWGAVVWLTTVVSMAVIELMFPGIYGGSLTIVAFDALMLAAYLALAWMAARERPP